METLRKANRRTANLLRMIEEMIDFAYMKDKGGVVGNHMTIPASKLFQETLARLETVMKQREITVRVNAPAKLEFHAPWDTSLMIMTNLVSNALRYSPSGSEVHVTAEREPGGIHVAVKDRGIGMSDEELGKIFEEFYRSPEARRMEQDGTGLGMSIVKRAVDSLGGRIMVVSEPGKGTVVHINLPDGD